MSSFNKVSTRCLLYIYIYVQDSNNSSNCILLELFWSCRVVTQSYWWKVYSETWCDFLCEQTIQTTANVNDF